MRRNFFLTALSGSVDTAALAGAAVDAYVASLSKTRPLEYRFDEASGNIINYGSAGASLNGTLTLGIGLRQQVGLLGKCLYFDGDTTKIVVPSHASLTGATLLQIVILCKPETAGESNTGVFFEDASGAHKNTFKFSNASLALTAGADGVTTDAGTNPGVNLTALDAVGLSWKVDDSGDKTLYVKVNSFDPPYTSQTPYTGALVPLSGFVIGNSAFNTQGYKGWMYRLYVFTQELSSAELKNIQRLATLPYDEGGTLPIGGGGGTFGSDLTIPNFGMEIGVNGWTQNITVVAGFTGSITSSTDKNTGLRSMRHATSNTGVSSSNNAMVTRNAPTLSTSSYYQLRMSYKANNDVPLNIRLRNTGSTLFKSLANVIDGVNWKTLVFNFKTPAGADTWVIDNTIANTLNGQSFEAYVDDIAITPITALSVSEFTIAAIGDSQVGHLGISSTTENDNPASFLSSSIRRMMLSPNHLFVIPPLNKGVSGDNSGQVLARVNADVISASPKPTYCYIAVGTNDVAQSVAISTTKSNIQATADALIAAGITPIIFTITPRSDGKDVTPYNTAILTLSPTYWVFDAYAVANADPLWGTYIAGDGLHYNVYGHLLLGKALGVYMLTNFFGGS